VTTNTTLFDTADPERFQPFFDKLMAMGVEGMMISPGYSYEKAPDQEHFLKRRGTIRLFQRLFAGAPRRWKFNQSPLFLLFLQGRYDLECTPWGNPTYNLFGWQKPCYLMQEGYAKTYQELLDSTDWSQYGRASGNPKCADCMVHSGYEPTAVSETFGTLRGFLTTVKATLLGTSGPRQTGSSTGSPPPGVTVRPEERLPVGNRGDHVRVPQSVTTDLPIVQLDR